MVRPLFLGIGVVADRRREATKLLEFAPRGGMDGLAEAKDELSFTYAWNRPQTRVLGLGGGQDYEIHVPAASNDPSLAAEPGPHFIGRGHVADVSFRVHKALLVTTAKVFEGFILNGKTRSVYGSGDGNSATLKSVGPEIVGRYLQWLYHVGPDASELDPTELVAQLAFAERVCDSAYYSAILSELKLYLDADHRALIVSYHAAISYEEICGCAVTAARFGLAALIPGIRETCRVTKAVAGMMNDGVIDEIRSADRDFAFKLVIDYAKSVSKETDDTVSKMIAELYDDDAIPLKSETRRRANKAALRKRRRSSPEF